MYRDYEFSPEDLFSAYLRKSQSDDPNEPIEVTLAKHKQRILEVAKRMNIKEEQIVFYEEVVSGDTIAERPQIQKMLHMVSDEYYKGTFVVAVDRFSRGDSIDQGIIDQTYYYSSTLIITPEKVYDIANNEMDREQLEFGLFMSKREYNLIKKRMYNGRVDNVKAGYFVSSITPYGYGKKRSEDKRGYILIPDEYESKIVKLMFEMFLDGVGTSTLAHHLNDIKAKARKSPIWTPAMVRNILNSPVYKGELIWNQRKITKKLINGAITKTVEIQKDYYTFKGKHEPLITPEQFDKTQQLLKSNSNKKITNNKELKNPLAGLILCGYCLKEYNLERQIFRRPYSRKIRNNPVRVYELDKEELRMFLYSHYKKSGLSYTEMANRLGVTRPGICTWITPNPKRFYPSRALAKKWFKLKEMLKIDTDKYDKAITTYKDDDSVHVDTLLCMVPTCKNVSSDLYLVEERLLKLIEKHLTDYKYLKDNYEQEIIKLKKKNDNSLDIIEKEIKKLNTRLESVMEAYELRDYTREQFLTRKEEIENSLSSLNTKKEKLLSESKEDKVEKIKKAIPILEKCLKEYYELDLVNKNKILHSIVNKAIYTKQNRAHQVRQEVKHDFILEVDFKI